MTGSSVKRYLLCCIRLMVEGATKPVARYFFPKRLFPRFDMGDAAVTVMVDRATAANRAEEAASSKKVINK